MNTRTNSANVPKACEKCGGKKLKSRTTTYPLQLGGRQVNIARVPLRECLDCHDLTPTPAGQTKIARAFSAMLQLNFFNA